MSIVSTITGLLKQVTPNGIAAVKTIIESAIASGDSERYLTRLALAESTTKAAKSAAATALKKTKKK